MKKQKTEKPKSEKPQAINIPDLLTQNIKALGLDPTSFRLACYSMWHKQGPSTVEPLTADVAQLVMGIPAAAYEKARATLLPYIDASGNIDGLLEALVKLGSNITEYGTVAPYTSTDARLLCAGISATQFAVCAYIAKNIRQHPHGWQLSQLRLSKDLGVRREWIVKVMGALRSRGLLVTTKTSAGVRYRLCLDAPTPTDSTKPGESTRATAESAASLEETRPTEQEAPDGPETAPAPLTAEQLEERRRDILELGGPTLLAGSDVWLTPLFEGADWLERLASSDPEWHATITNASISDDSARKLINKLGEAKCNAWLAEQDRQAAEARAFLEAAPLPVDAHVLASYWLVESRNSVLSAAMQRALYNLGRYDSDEGRSDLSPARAEQLAKDVAAREAAERLARAELPALFTHTDRIRAAVAEMKKRELEQIRQDHRRSAVERIKGAPGEVRLSPDWDQSDIMRAIAAADSETEQLPIVRLLRAHMDSYERHGRLLSVQGENAVGDEIFGSPVAVEAVVQVVSVASSKASTADMSDAAFRALVEERPADRKSVPQEQAAKVYGIRVGVARFDLDMLGLDAWRSDDFDGYEEGWTSPSIGMKPIEAAQ